VTPQQFVPSHPAPSSPAARSTRVLTARSVSLGPSR
jgi:hypothetical protein